MDIRIAEKSSVDVTEGKYTTSAKECQGYPDGITRL